MSDDESKHNTVDGALTWDGDSFTAWLVHEWWIVPRARTAPPSQPEGVSPARDPDQGPRPSSPGPECL